jgi:hypothetical protein
MKQVVLDREVEGSEAALFTPVFPERLPAWNKLLATHSGWLWVRREPPPTETEFNTWDIYDPDGRLTAWIRIPMTAV